MISFITPWRIFVAAITHIVRNAWLALATVLVLVLALLSVNVLLGVQVALDRSVEILEEKIDLSIRFKPGTSEGIATSAKLFLSALGSVESVTTISAEDALNAFRERHGSQPELIGALGELDQNPLGPVLVVKAKQTSAYPQIVEALQNPQFSFAIESKSYDDHADAIATVKRIRESAQWFGLMLISVFGLFSILLVYNAIRVAIYTQREEIGVMRLVGASNSYIRLPFVLEALFFAAFATVLTAGMTIAAAYSLDPKLAVVFGGEAPGFVAFFQDQWLQIFGLQFVILGGLVILASWAAVGKYLKR